MKTVLKVLGIIAVFLGVFFGSMWLASANIEIGFGKNTSTIFLDLVMKEEGQLRLIEFGNGLVTGIEVFPELNSTLVFISDPRTQKWNEIVQVIRRADHEILSSIPVLNIVKDYYGEMYWDELDNPLSVIAPNGAFVPLVGLESDFGNTIIYQNSSQLNITLDGLYRLNYFVNYQDSNNQKYDWGIAMNSEIINGTIVRTQINHNSPRLASGTKLVELLENDLITLEVAGDGSSGILDVLSANLNIVRVGPLE